MNFSQVFGWVSTKMLFQPDSARALSSTKRGGWVYFMSEPDSAHVEHMFQPDSVRLPPVLLATLTYVATGH